MKVLFIGGTGVISSACSELCMETGIDLFLLNRNMTNSSGIAGARQIFADIRNVEDVKNAIRKESFDVVVDWIAYTPEHILADFELFRDKTAQYVFISSASVYRKPPLTLPIKETEKLENPFWQYSQNKIDCENKLNELRHIYDFPATIVRPSHTYDKTKIPLHGGYTTLDRMLKGRKIIIHGDGTSLWTLTHHKDFAKGFCPILGRKETIGEAFHITSDDALTWNQICHYMGGALGVEPEIIHIPSDYISRFDKEWGEGLLGDKAHSMIFDNSKIKKLNPGFKAAVSFREGAKEIVSWYLESDERKKTDYEKDKTMERIIASFEASYKKWWEKD
jgi:nucleoside-diphosphate-sugar epimerase